jgi:hypothetical protein
MSLRLKSPREGRSPYWYVRGTFLGITLDRSTVLRGQRRCSSYESGSEKSPGGNITPFPRQA